jgi:hypothetical protein
MVAEYLPMLFIKLYSLQISTTSQRTCPQSVKHIAKELAASARESSLHARCLASVSFALLREGFHEREDPRRGELSRPEIS